MSRPLTDSPWFWLGLFLLTGLLGLWAIGPKNAQRQMRLERMHDTRTRVQVERSGGEMPETDVVVARGEPSEHMPRVIVFFVVMMLVAATAWRAVRIAQHKSTEPSS